MTELELEGYQTDIWRGQGGEERCELRELIRKCCPIGFERFYPSDVDIAPRIYLVIENGVNPIKVWALYEKKIGDVEYETWQKIQHKELSRYIRSGISIDKEKGYLVTYGGFHLIRVPDNEDWGKWNYVIYDEYKITIPQLIKLLKFDLEFSLKDDLEKTIECFLRKEAVFYG